MYIVDHIKSGRECVTVHLDGNNRQLRYELLGGDQKAALMELARYRTLDCGYVSVTEFEVAMVRYGAEVRRADEDQSGEDTNEACT